MRKRYDDYDPVAGERIREALAAPIEQRAPEPKRSQPPPEELERWKIQPVATRTQRRKRF